MATRRLSFAVLAGVFSLSVGIAMIAKTVRPAAAADVVPVVDLTRPSDAVRGARLYAMTCAQCHGTAGRGMPRQGPTLRESKFVAGHDDRRLIAFVRVGRSAYAGDSLMRMSMPAKGGSPTYTDNDLGDIVAHLRTLQPAALAAARPTRDRRPSTD